MSIESIEKTPSIEVLKLVEEINENFETAKKKVEKAYTLLIRDDWEPKQAKQYLYDNINLHQTTIRKYIPLEAKDLSKARTKTKDKDENIATSDEIFASSDSQKTEEEKQKVVNISKEHKVVDLEPVTETQTEEPEPEEYTVNLSYFKPIANGMDKFYFENLDYQQMQGKLSDLTFRGDKFDFAIQRRSKK